MTIKANPLDDGLSPKAVQELYNIVLEQKFCYQERLDRVQKEIGEVIIALDNGKEVSIEDMKRGLKNLFIYLDLKPNIKHEANRDLNSNDIIGKHEASIREFYSKKTK